MTTTTTKEKDSVKAASEKAKTQKVIANSKQIAELVNPFKAELKAIRDENTMAISDNLDHMISVGMKLITIEERVKVFKEEHKGGLFVLVNEKKFDLCIFTNCINYLNSIDELPFKYSRASKLIAIAKQSDEFRKVKKEDRQRLNLGDANNSYKLATAFKGGKSLKAFEKELEEKANQEKPEKRKSFSIFNAEKQINVTFLESVYSNEGNVKIQLLNLLIEELGFNALSSTMKTALIESFKQVERAK